MSFASTALSAFAIEYISEATLEDWYGASETVAFPQYKEFLCNTKRFADSVKKGGTPFQSSSFP